MWNKLFFNVQNVECESDRAVLINCPIRSEYKGWSFWHPSKLVREEGGKGWHLSFSFTNDWEFKVFKKHKDGNKIEKTISADEMKIVFKTSNETIKRN